MNESSAMMEQAFEKFDIGLLDKALEAGADINAQVAGVPLLSDAFWTNSDAIRNGLDQSYIRQVKEFIKYAIEKGLDINAYEVDGGMKYPILFQSCHYLKNQNITEFLLQNDADPNFMVADHDFFKEKLNMHNVENHSLLDAIMDEFDNETHIGYYDFAKAYHDDYLLLIAYGAKPAELLDGSHGMPRHIYDAVMSLDAEKLRILSRDECNRIDIILTFYGRFGYPKLFYYHPDEFQEKLIMALDAVISKLGIDNLSPTLLCDCVANEWPDVVDFLLSKGVDPNINCSSETFKDISSSALDYLGRISFVFKRENYERMKTSLMNANAKINKKTYYYE